MKTTTTLAVVTAAGIIAHLADRLRREQAVTRIQDQALVIATTEMRDLRIALGLEQEIVESLVAAFTEHPEQEWS